MYQLQLQVLRLRRARGARARVAGCRSSISEKRKLHAGSSSPAERSSPGSSNVKKTTRCAKVRTDGSGSKRINHFSREDRSSPDVVARAEKRNYYQILVFKLHTCFILPATEAENKSKKICIAAEQTDETLILRDFFSFFVFFLSLFFLKDQEYRNPGDDAPRFAPLPPALLHMWVFLRGFYLHLPGMFIEVTYFEKKVYFLKLQLKL